MQIYNWMVYVHSLICSLPSLPDQMVDADQVTTRSDTVSNVVLAEIYHYQHERVVDFRDLFKSLIQAKIQFYKEVCGFFYMSLILCWWHD